MSHVDKALSAWEADAKIPSRPVPERFRLDQYHREEPATAPAAPEPPAPVLPVPEASTSARRSPSAATSVSESGFRMSFAPARSPAPATLPPSPRAHTFQPTPELEARLVTGGSGAVPLEQYRRLAAALHDVQLQQGLKTLMLTSALPHEGKTLTVVNLALTLSESYGRRVLIIDADLRWPSVHRMFGLGNETGLSEALLGQVHGLPIRQVGPRLCLLSAGQPGPAPLAALTSAQMGALIDQCADQFDWVLLDTPPVGLMPDAQLLARLTRAVVLVIAAGATPATAVQRAVEELGPDSIIGTVLNRVDNRQMPEAGYYAQYGGRQDQ